MILNEHLNIRLGVEFEDLYNALAVNEILENKEKYPLIAPSIEDQKKDAEDAETEWDYDSWLFECDDPETCASYDETMELYQAFLCAFAKDIKNKEINVTYAAFGIDYLDKANTHNILDPRVHYLGGTYITVCEGQISLNKETYNPICSGQAHYGLKSIEEQKTHYLTNTEEVLNKIAEGIKNLADYSLFIANRFENEELQMNSCKLKNGEAAYPYDFYFFSVGENWIKLFSTERGFDALSILRKPILDSLTDEQKENDIVKEIEKIQY